MSTKAAIYARISLEDEAVPKVDNQIAACQVLADANGLAVAPEHIFKDNGIPATGKRSREGTRDKRDGFNALLLAAEKGEFSTIIVVAGDRLSRNYPDGLDVVDACVDGDVTILSEDDGAIDPRTPAGEDQLMSLFTGGRKDIRKRSLKQRGRYTAERAKGMPLWGRRPFGWDWVPEKGANGKTSRRPMIKNEKEAAAIKWAVQYFAKPEGTIYGVIKAWNDEFKVKSTAAGYARKKPVAGNQTFSGDWTNASVRTILRNPRIAGLVAVGGEVMRDADGEPLKGEWPAIIENVADWQAVVDKLNDPSRRTNAGRKASSLGSGLVFCVCGLPLRATTIVGKPLGEPDSPPQKLPGLRCDVNRNQAPSRKAVTQHVSMRSDVLDPLLSLEVAKAFTFGPANLIPTGELDLSALEVEAAALRQAEDNAGELALLGGASATKARKRIVEIHTRLDEIEAARIEAVSKSAHAAMVVDLRKNLWTSKTTSFKDAGDALVALRERFEALPLHQRRELVKTLLHVEVMPGQGVKVDPEKRVIILHKVVRTLNTDEENEYLAALGV